MRGLQTGLRGCERVVAPSSVTPEISGQVRGAKTHGLMVVCGVELQQATVSPWDIKTLGFDRQHYSMTCGLSHQSVLGRVWMEGSH
ncbi:hypothetical protein JOB18_011783 [Solea senegalensis]|uniref:Uncharacterized protein n=1 Tax=Solea senegalensis TaxID=28829 RepID=A0AAV6T5A6_SOLSE|nr:hypothetical protein JOB18_011783 [Solea senegalensis]